MTACSRCNRPIPGVILPRSVAMVCADCAPVMEARPTDWARIRETMAVLAKPANGRRKGRV
jgi:hypothetical protein